MRGVSPPKERVHFLREEGWSVKKMIRRLVLTRTYQLSSANDAAKTNRDGYWSGDYFFKLVHKLPGAWEAKRPQ